MIEWLLKLLIAQLIVQPISFWLDAPWYATLSMLVAAWLLVEAGTK